MFSRAYQMTSEFRAKQGAFDFAAVALAVLDVVVETKKRLASMLKSTLAGLKSWMPKPVVRKPHQLILELDSIAQIPLI